jgi:hypothetical protein
MKTYRGSHYGARVEIEENDRIRPLDPRFDLANHSPSGFAWGYGGSGPAQLALALLADVYGDDKIALIYHQSFKWKVVARLEQNAPWTLTEEAIREAFRTLRPREESGIA